MGRMISSLGQAKLWWLRFASRLFDRFPAIRHVWYANGSIFHDEVKAVASGNRKHARDTNPNSERAIYTLRRNTHRLEKGLIMRPRRDIFALDYIEKTVASYSEVYSTLETSGDDTKDVIQWASDVLEQYFECVDVQNNGKLKRCYEKYQHVRHDQAIATQGWSPYTRPTNDLNIEVEKLKELSIRRRSCRWYLPKPVPREIIDKAMDVARYAPSACNRQPFYFRVFDEPSEASQVGSIPMGTKGFSDNFPCFIVIVGNLAAFPHPRDRHVIYIDASLAAMSFQYALEVQGIGSCCINWPDIPEKNRAIAKRLNLETHERVVMCMSLGYPDPEGQVPYSQKKATSDLLRYSQI